MVYEAGRLRYFLPQLYVLWQEHPDPWQNMQFNLTTKKKEDGTWSNVIVYFLFKQMLSQVFL